MSSRWGASEGGGRRGRAGTGVRGSQGAVRGGGGGCFAWLLAWTLAWRRWAGKLAPGGRGGRLHRPRPRTSRACRPPPPPKAPSLPGSCHLPCPGPCHPERIVTLRPPSLPPSLSPPPLPDCAQHNNGTAAAFDLPLATAAGVLPRGTAHIIIRRARKARGHRAAAARARGAAGCAGAARGALVGRAGLCVHAIPARARQGCASLTMPSHWQIRQACDSGSALGASGRSAVCADGWRGVRGWLEARLAGEARGWLQGPADPCRPWGRNPGGSPATVRPVCTCSELLCAAVHCPLAGMGVRVQSGQDTGSGRMGRNRWYQRRPLPSVSFWPIT